MIGKSIYMYKTINIFFYCFLEFCTIFVMFLALIVFHNVEVPLIREAFLFLIIFCN